MAVDVEVEIERAPKAMNQRHRARLRPLVVTAGDLEHMTRDGAIDDARSKSRVACSRRLRVARHGSPCS